MKYLLSAKFQRFKDELAQGEEGYLNYAAVKFGQQRYVQSVMAIQNIYCAQESGGQGNYQKKSLFLFALGKVL